MRLNSAVRLRFESRCGYNVCALSGCSLFEIMASESTRRISGAFSLSSSVSIRGRSTLAQAWGLRSAKKLSSAMAAGFGSNPCRAKAQLLILLCQRWTPLSPLRSSTEPPACREHATGYVGTTGLEARQKVGHRFFQDAHGKHPYPTAR